jgi:alpha-mannosidase
MSEKPLIYLIPHFHYDPVWLEDQRTYTAHAFDLVTQYLDAARQDPSFKFILGEPDYLKPYWDAFPGQRAFLRQLVVQGRLEINAGYNEPNETSIQGEALIRNLLYGRLFQQGVLGAAPRVYLPLDVFGHCPQLPQILRQLGFAACIFSKDIAGAEPLCRAMALDGSEIIQKHEHYWFNPQSWEELVANVVAGPEVASTGPQPAGLEVDLRFIGMDMQPPPRWLLARGDQLSQHAPALRVGVPEEYLKAVEERLAAGAAQLPLSSRDLAMYHAGTTVSRIELKIANRLAENALLGAERFCAIAWLLGAEYPHAALDKAWRLLMFGQHHDAITGTSCDISFLDLAAMYREALEIAEWVKSDALDALAGVADTSLPRGEALCALVVFNPLPWERTDLCRARLKFHPPTPGFDLREAGRREVACQVIWDRREGEAIAEAEIAFVARQVPALGYSVYHVVAATRPPRAGEMREADRAVIANEYYSVSAAASAGGGLISVLDRHTRRQILDLTRGHPGNEIATLGEQADRRQPAWTIWTTGEESFSGEEPARVWVERGPARERIIIEGSAPGCSGRRQEIALYPGVRRVDFMTELRGYRGEHQLFAVTFPIGLSGCMPVFEERFGAVARRRSAGVLDFRTYKGEAASGGALLPAQSWMELGNCLRIAARSSRGRAEAGFSVGYAAVITGTGEESQRAGERLMRALAGRGITAGAYANEEDVAAHRLEATFRFRISVAGDQQRAQELVESALADVRAAAAKTLQRSGYAFVLMLEPADGDGGGVPALLILARDGETAAAAVDQLQKDAADGVIWLAGQSNAVALRPFDSAPSTALGTGQDKQAQGHPERSRGVGEAQPLPDDYGVALINLGNIGASVEADGTGVIALMHTAAWPNHPWGEGKLDKPFVPEHKDHRFFYSLCAHAGDWRRGEVTRRAQEFNQPLAARQCAARQEAADGTPQGTLPSRHSFLSLEPANVFLSALKPRGSPPAMGAHRDGKDDAPSLIARIYEGHGEPARGELSSPFSVTQAWQSDVMEARGAELRVTGGKVALELLPYRIETLELAAPRQSLLSGVSFGPQHEAAQPLHMRYWEHNLGPAPMGNQPVTVTIQGAPAVGATTRFTLSVANAQVDTEAVGTVRMLVPEGWMITPAQVPFRVPGAGAQDFELAIIIPADARPGYIRAQVEIEGQVYQEVLAVGELKPVAASARRAGSRFEVILRNPNPESAQGRVDMITPLETWGAAAGEFARACVAPTVQGFDLGPGAETTLVFEVTAYPRAERCEQGCEPDFWAFARIACHGQVQYLRAA